jgi:hypothetical protein
MLTSNMKISGGNLKWWTYPTSDQRRWFVILPPEVVTPVRDVTIDLDLKGMLGPRSLSFAFRVEQLPGYLPTSDQVGFTVATSDSYGQTRELFARDAASRGLPGRAQTEIIRVDLPEDASAVHISFPAVADKEFVRVMELKLTSVDVEPTMIRQLCTNAPKNAS